ncbi:hypothetical protein C8J56DRAFT_912593 [Mycena floridula]|nr:hypothetical protein C8J56DRAFT_912593 [Mycena floridula]
MLALDDAGKQRIFNEIRRRPLPSDRMSWMRSSPTPGPCTECLSSQDSETCVVYEQQVGGCCSFCSEKRRKCSLIPEERRYRVKTKFNLDDAAYDSLLAEFQALPTKPRMRNPYRPASSSTAIYPSPSSSNDVPGASSASARPQSQRDRRQAHDDDAEVDELEAVIRERDMLANRVKELEFEVADNHKLRVLEITEGILLNDVASRVLEDFDSGNINAEEAIETFRQLPVLAQKDTQWRLEQLGDMPLHYFDLSNLTGLGKRGASNSGDSNPKRHRTK